MFDLMRLMKDNTHKDIAESTGLNVNTIKKWYRTDKYGTRNPTYRSRVLIAMAYGYRIELVPVDRSNETITVSKGTISL